MILKCYQASKRFPSSSIHLSLPWLSLLFLLVRVVNGMTSGEIQALRQETERMFFHGYDNYIAYAFPEDELRPLSCKPLTRDVANPAHVELNDPLGNYSLTLIDSLSTLAVQASNPGSERQTQRSWRAFQRGVVSLIELYGDGTQGHGGQGTRARGFDLDSKVQVFETVIRGVGGLLSAHLFAIGELPITGYDPSQATRIDANGRPRIQWSEEFFYDGQLLRLAHDMARRLLPAFSSPTGIPYPRVNLRHGVPFYPNSRLNKVSQSCHADGAEQCPVPLQPNHEQTETCSAGAGSLLLEFIVLSRLTGDQQYEQLAKRAFWSVWDRRSNTGLVGAGIDAESGVWVGASTGLGAGIDSFFEYAAKTYVLLSGSSPFNTSSSGSVSHTDGFEPLSALQQGADGFLGVWQESYAAIKRHLLRSEMYIHPHYIQANIMTGAAQGFWMDSLSAFFPGLLTLVGEVEDAIKMHLLSTALWARYSALPERWSTVTGGVESNLGWWGGRPEFVESTYHLYRATRDPWYLHVGEMALRDIKRRCWAKCGWAGLQDVRTGEQSDRMESFFLGETTKYFNLLFYPDHPLNSMDAAVVFTTEGHPLLIPKQSHGPQLQKSSPPLQEHRGPSPTCPARPSNIPFSISATAARRDTYHAANLARLQFMPTRETVESPLVDYSHDHPSITLADVRSPTNFTHYPWTLPPHLIPHDATCAPLKPRPQFDITFPPMPSALLTPGPIHRIMNGIVIGGMGGLRLGMIQDAPILGSDGGKIEPDQYRIHSINNFPLGVDEKVFLPRDIFFSVVNAMDPNFYRLRNPETLDIVVDVTQESTVTHQSDGLPAGANSLGHGQFAAQPRLQQLALGGLQGGSGSDPSSNMRLAFGSLMQHVSSIIGDHRQPPNPNPPQTHREYITAILPSGPGVAMLPDFVETLGPDKDGKPRGPLLFHSIYIGDENCKSPLPKSVPREHQIIVLKRGDCSFHQKLQMIPNHAPSAVGLQLVIVVSFDEEDTGDWLTRPLIEREQRTVAGMRRVNPIPMVLVGGGAETWGMLERAEGVGVKRRWSVKAQGVGINNLIII